jgi:hypothetical protein
VAGRAAGRFPVPGPGSASRRRRGIYVLAPILVATACSSRPIVLPAGPGTPAPEAAAALAEATSDCRGATSLSASLRVSGHAGERRLRAPILIGVTAANQVRLEAPSAFVLAGSSARATLVLQHDRRELVAPADDIIEALTGLKLGPTALLGILSGCGGRSETMSAASAYGEVIGVTTPDGRVYLARAGAARWRVKAADLADIVVEYRAWQDRWPSDIRLQSKPGRTPVIDLSISSTQVDVNTTLAEAVFTVAVPAGATPLTLDELRAAGPLGVKRE